jgi:hypothetical protein
MRGQATGDELEDELIMANHPSQENEESIMNSCKETKRSGEKKNEAPELGHGVERERAEEVAAHAGLDLDEGAGGGVDPVDGEAFARGGEFGFEIDVADEARGSGDDEEQVFKRLPRARRRLMVFSWPSAPAR